MAKQPLTKEEIERRELSKENRAKHQDELAARLLADGWETCPGQQPQKMGPDGHMLNAKLYNESHQQVHCPSCKQWVDGSKAPSDGKLSLIKHFRRPVSA